MLSLNRIRKNPDDIKTGVQSKNESIHLDEILKTDTHYREKVHELDELRAKRNKSSDAIAQAKRDGVNSDKAIAEMRAVSDTIKSIEKEVNDIKNLLDTKLELIPNIPHSNVPVGKDESSNVIIREWGEPKNVEYKLKSHVDLGTSLELFDLRLLYFFV